MKTEEHTKVPPKINENTAQIIYADKIIGIGLGASVSKLHFGVEVNPNEYTVTTTLMIPTISLIEAISLIQTSLTQSEHKEVLIAGIDSIKELYSNL